MSWTALAWAAKYQARSASEKLVLLAYAECHNEETGCAFPSITWLCEFSSLNRKTVIASVARLEKAGCLEDTGQRMGRTKQLKVYRLNLNIGTNLRGETHYVYRLTDAQTGEFYVGVRSCLGSPENDSYQGSGKWPTGAAFRANVLLKTIVSTHDTRTEAEEAEAAAIYEAMKHPLCKNISKEYLKRDRKKTVPKSANSTDFSVEESQKRDTEPSREPVSQKASPSSKARAKRKTGIPANFQPAMAGKTAAIVAEWPPGRLEDELEHFTDHHTAKGTLSFDWDASWRTWVKNSRKWEPRYGRSELLYPSTGSRGSRPDPALDLLRASQRAGEAERVANCGRDHRETGPALPSIWTG